MSHRKAAQRVKLLERIRDAEKSFKELILAILDTLRDETEDSHDGPFLRFVMKFPNNVTVKGASMSTLVPVDQFVQVAVELEDKFGNTDAALPSGESLSWAVADSTLATITPSADGKSAVVYPTGKEGTTQVSVTAGSIVGVFDAQFVAGSLSVVQLNPSVVTTDPNAAAAASTGAAATGTDTSGTAATGADASAAAAPAASDQSGQAAAPAADASAGTAQS